MATSILEIDNLKTNSLKDELTLYLDSCAVKRRAWILKTKIFYFFMGAFIATLFSFAHVIVYGDSIGKPMEPVKYYEVQRIK